jgi:hypothetical protein
MKNTYVERVVKTVIATPTRETPMQLEVVLPDGSSQFLHRTATMAQVASFMAHHNVRRLEVVR